MIERSAAGPAYQATIVGSSDGPRERVQAKIEEDRHILGNEVAQLRLLQEYLEKRRESDQAERERLLAFIERQEARYQTQTAELHREVKEQAQAMLALSGEAAQAAMAQLERAKITAELLHEQRKEPPQSVGADLGKHAISMLSGVLKDVLLGNPALAAKAGDLVAAVASATQQASQPAARVSLGQLAAARDTLTDEEVAALCQAHNCNEESLPVDVLLAAAAAKRDAHAAG